jgi:Mn-containing catalase
VPAGRWTEGVSLDGKGKFEPMISEPLGGEPVLAPPRPDGGAQREQTAAAAPRAANDPSGSTSSVA